MTLSARGSGRPTSPLAARSEQGAPWARDYVGLPWKPYGRDRRGIDCWGLLCLVYRERYGIALPLHEGLSIGAATPTGRAAERAAIAALMAEHRSDWRPVAAGAERVGDAVLLRIGRAACHVGLVIEPGTMLHIEAGIDAALESYRGAMWAHQLSGIYRHASLDR